MGAYLRSGTNFLKDAICLHPDCQFSRVPEDFIIAEAAKLKIYTDAVIARWGPSWNFLKNAFENNLRSGLLEFCKGRSDEPIRVCKSPSSEGIELADWMFPSCKIVAIIRDGRDTFESGRRSFGWKMRERVPLWLQGVKRIDDFERDNPGRAHVLKYEDLVNNPKATIENLLGYLSLDPTIYDFDTAVNLPLRGSSDMVARDGFIDWDPHPKHAGFSPIGRWKQTWSKDDIAEFETIAGEYNRKLGYA